MKQLPRPICYLQQRQQPPQPFSFEDCLSFASQPAQFGIFHPTKFLLFSLPLLSPRSLAPFRPPNFPIPSVGFYRLYLRVTVAFVSPPRRCNATNRPPRQARRSPSPPIFVISFPLRGRNNGSFRTKCQRGERSLDRKRDDTCELASNCYIYPNPPRVPPSARLQIIVAERRNWFAAAACQFLTGARVNFTLRHAALDASINL